MTFDNVRYVTVEDMAHCRETRAMRQAALLKKYGVTLLSFTLNIPGEIKLNPLIYKAYRLAKRTILRRLEYLKFSILHIEEKYAHTGCELLIALDSEAEKVKKALYALEEASEFGRLLDIDVINTEGIKISRAKLNLPERKCLICSFPVSECAPQRKHSGQELFQKTQEIIINALNDDIAGHISCKAQTALLLEATTSPKPGLVDRLNSGAHTDMNLDTFCISAAALGEYFYACALEGAEVESLDTAMPKLRNLGIIAEEEMYTATSGVNTHKGAIYGLGILSCAAAYLLKLNDKINTDDIFEACKTIAAKETTKLPELAKGEQLTGGIEQYASYGLTGARGEAAQGFPSVKDVSLLAFTEGLQKGYSYEKTGVYALIHLMAKLFDSNVIRRKGMEAQKLLQKKAQKILDDGFSLQAVTKLDEELIREGISPGGCADLLAYTYFVYSLTA